MPQVDVKRTFKITSDGITLVCQLSAPPGTPTKQIEDNISRLEGFVTDRDQTKLDFESAITMNGLTVVTDKPKVGDREFQFRFDALNLSYETRAKIYAYAQNGKKLTLKLVEEPEPKKAGKAKDEKPVEDKDGKTFTTVDNCLLAAVDHTGLTTSTWRIGASDQDIRDFFSRSLKDPITGYDGDGFGFVARALKGKRGVELKLWVAEVPGIPANVNGKPAIQNAELVTRVRELLSIPKPEKKG